MVIEMLLNNDIQLFFVQIILNFQKEIHVLPQQVGWFDGKGVCLHSKGQGIKPHEWCYVWSTIVC